jgi:hypothetical protein
MSYFFSSVNKFFSSEEPNDTSLSREAEEIEKVSKRVGDLQIEQSELSARQQRYEGERLTALSEEHAYREEQSKRFSEIDDTVTQVQQVQQRHEQQIRASKQVRSTVYDEIRQNSCEIEDKILETQYADELIEFHSHFTGLLENRIMTLRNLASEAFVPHDDLIQGAHSRVKKSRRVKHTPDKSGVVVN